MVERIFITGGDFFWGSVNPHHHKKALMVIIDKQGGIVKIRIARGSVDDPFISLETLLHFLWVSSGCHY